MRVAGCKHIAWIALLALASSCSIRGDREDARLALARMHRNISEANLSAIYKDASPAFRAVGSEEAFVAGLQRLQDKLGNLKSATERIYQTSWDSTLGRTHVLISDLEYDRGRAVERAMLARSPEGRMELLRLDIQPVPGP